MKPVTTNFCHGLTTRTDVKNRGVTREKKKEKKRKRKMSKHKRRKGAVGRPKKTQMP
jgi:hypothetical protein